MSSMRQKATQAWDRALMVPYDVSLRSAKNLREEFPHLTPAELLEVANRRFIRRVSLESAAVGGAAALPGAGTAVSVAASSAQLVAFISEAAHHALLVAHLHGLDIRDPAKRTALVLAALTGEEGAELISAQVGIRAVSWFRSSFLNIQTLSAERFNKLMMKWVQRRIARSAVANTVGRLVPFGIGAAVGWGIGKSLANNVIEGLEMALGPAPQSFIDGIAVDVDNTHEGPVESAYAQLRLPK
ncbi:MAG: VPDSG-CTERM exosortase interaction domain protein [Actinomycetaceae bacterium]|nr:VPDSG-CTERM exosortase interaction domain protein [Actinomycetaceae bacterium]